MPRCLLVLGILNEEMKIFQMVLVLGKILASTKREEKEIVDATTVVYLQHTGNNFNEKDIYSLLPKSTNK